VALTHLALDLGFGYQCGDRVDDHQINRARAHQDLDDLESLLTGVRLRDEQILDIDTELFGIVDVERVLSVHIGGHAPHFLDVSGQVEGKSGLAGRFRSIDLGNPAPRYAADTGSGIEIDGAGGNGGDLDPGGVGAHAHDGSLAELLLDLGDGQSERFTTIGFEPGFVSSHCFLVKK
jgi:hypothetical protein